MAVALVLVANVATSSAITAGLGRDPATQDPVIRGAGASTAITGSYIVRLKDDGWVRSRGLAGAARDLVAAYHGRLGYVLDGRVHGFSVAMGAADAERLAGEADVAYVAQDQQIRMSDGQLRPGWALDRIDQRMLPLNDVYAYPRSGGQGVHAYIVDSGIRATHHDFGGRVTLGPNFAGDGRPDSTDCTGHGTAVAGLVGGATHGVAKTVQLVAVKIFNCDTRLGSISGLAAAIKWVIGDVRLHGWPAVINLSENGCATEAGILCDPSAYQPVVDAIKDAIGAGIPVVKSAGNENTDACADPELGDTTAIGVGAIMIAPDNSEDLRWVDASDDGSNFGACVELFAPGKDVASDGYTSDDAVLNDLTGTSFAAPLVTGAVALLLATPRFAHAPPAVIQDLLDDGSTRDALDPLTLGPGSPNLLLFSNAALPSTGPAVALAAQADGRLTLFGVSKDDYIVCRSQPSVGSATWGGWTRTRTPGFFSVAAATDPTGRIGLAGLSRNMQIWYRRQAQPSNKPDTDPATWGTWHQSDGLLTVVALAPNADGRMEMVGVNEQGQLFRRAQTSSVNADWRPWQQFSPAGPVARFRFVAAALNANGLIEVVAVAVDGTVWTTVQSQRNTDGWTPFITPDGPNAPGPVSEVALAHNHDGGLEMVATDALGGVFHRAETSPGSDTWPVWTVLPGGKTLYHIAAATNASSQTVLIVGSDQEGNIWQSTQTAANAGTYTPWSQVDGQFRL